MPVDELSLHEECFFPTITQMADGEVYLQVGTNDGSPRIIRVTGLEGIRRLPEMPILATAEMLRNASEATLALEAKRQNNQTPREMRSSACLS